jgi:hypothetical protein
MNVFLFFLLEILIFDLHEYPFHFVKIRLTVQVEVFWVVTPVEGLP